MKTKKDAEQLAAAMTSVGESMGVKTAHLLSPMDEPLGRAVGNALEVAECVEILQGGGPPDLVKLIVAKGQGHNYWEGFFRCQELVNFVVARARAGQDAKGQEEE